MMRGVVVVIFLSLWAGFIGCAEHVAISPEDADSVGGSPSESAETSRGSIIADIPEKTLSKAEVEAELGSFAVAMPELADHAVAIRRLVYKTISPSGRPTIASGTIAYPTDATGALPILSYQHGTAIYRHYGETSNEVTLLPIIFATAGYVTVVPDYLGLESSPGLHPYVHADSLATAVIDMLRAGKEKAGDEGLDLSGQTFLMGYSEGGYATLATERAIEKSYSKEFDLTAVAPMAGPYDLAGTMSALFSSEEENQNPFYLAYLVLAYNQIYRFSDSPDSVDDLFVASVASKIDGLFDGTHTGREINEALPKVPREMLDADFFEKFKNDPNHPLRKALKENDLYRFKPWAPLKLYHCNGDDVVPFQNAETAYDAFKDAGAPNVELVEVEGDSHTACAAPIILQGKEWFDSLVE